jgi:RND family efflux transporter MFP subunit
MELLMASVRTLLHASLALLLTVGCGKPSAETQAASPAPETAAAAPEVAPAAATVAPAAEKSSELFEAGGVAKPARVSPLTPKVGGILKTLRAREGTWANAGDTLFVLDGTDIALRAEAAGVAYNQAQLGVKNALSDLKRAQELFKGGAMTDQGVEKAQLGADMAKLQAEGASVAMRMAPQAVSDASIRAPFAGVVTKVMAEEGQMITTMPPTVVMVIAETTTLEVRVAVPERLLAQIHKDSPVHVTLPAIGLERDAKVDRMPDVIDSMTRSAEAVIRLDNRDRAIPAGLYARVTFPGVRAETADAVASGMKDAKAEVHVQ